MANKIRTVHVRVERGGLVVQGQGRTARDQKYIAATETLAVKDMADEKFKQEMALAVKKLYNDAE